MNKPLKQSLVHMSRMLENAKVISFFISHQHLVKAYVSGNIDAVEKETIRAAGGPKKKQWKWGSTLALLIMTGHPATGKALAQRLVHRATQDERVAFLMLEVVGSICRGMNPIVSEGAKKNREQNPFKAIEPKGWYLKWALSLNANDFKLPLGPQGEIKSNGWGLIFTAIAPWASRDAMEGDKQPRRDWFKNILLEGLDRLMELPISVSTETFKEMAEHPEALKTPLDIWMRQDHPMREVFFAEHEKTIIKQSLLRGESLLEVETPSPGQTKTRL